MRKMNGKGFQNEDFNSTSLSFRPLNPRTNHCQRPTWIRKSKVGTKAKIINHIIFKKCDV